VRSGNILDRFIPTCRANPQIATRTAQVISDLERFGVKPGAGVTHAVNLIDSWTILTGRYADLLPPCFTALLLCWVVSVTH
jgi:hypothetical protein